MIEKLKKDDKKDQDRAAECKADIKKTMESARDSAMAADENTDNITQNDADIEEAEGKIKQYEEETEKAKKEKEDAIEKHQEDKELHLQENSDDSQAKELVDKAIKVLKKTYKQSGTFLQRSAQPNLKENGAPELKMEGDYKGAAGGGNIVSVLDMISKDLQAELDESAADWKATT